MNTDQAVDFTREKYRLLLSVAKDNYCFTTYNNIDTSSKFLLWRHDVDLSIHSALQLAKIEKEVGVRATYFLLPHSQFYNLFELEVLECVKEIISLGHDIGLHFDIAMYDFECQKDFEKKLKMEKRWLADLFEVEVKAFSFHNPSSQSNIYQNSCYSGLINCYSKYFREQVGYCSDSNGYWRHRSIFDVISSGEYERLQILTHPGWWQKRVMKPRERVARCVEGRSKKNMREYDRLLQEHGRKNLGKNN